MIVAFLFKTADSHAMQRLHILAGAAAGLFVLASP